MTDLPADADLMLLGAGHPVAATAVVTPAGTRVQVRGAAREAESEIGSVSKALTGLLYADAVGRGEVTPGTRLADVLPLAGSAVGAVTLGSLATHRSGLPRLVAAARPWRATWDLWRHGTNPYGETLPEFLDQCRPQRLGRGRPRYSNAGFALLGHALAAAAGMRYADLVADRLAGPLGLPGVSVPASPGDLTARSLVGTSRRGRPVEAWTGEGIGPAGGIRAPIDALAGLLEALLAGTAPGVAALEPVAGLGWGARIGAGWLVSSPEGRPVTWHNGGTGGFRSFVGLDRAGGVGVAVLSATARSVDAPGFALLAAARP